MILTRRDPETRAYIAQTVTHGQVHTATRRSGNAAVRAVLRLAYPSPVRGAVVS